MIQKWSRSIEGGRENTDDLASWTSLKHLVCGLSRVYVSVYVGYCVIFVISSKCQTSVCLLFLKEEFETIKRIMTIIVVLLVMTWKWMFNLKSQWGFCHYYQFSTALVITSDQFCWTCELAAYESSPDCEERELFVSLKGKGSATGQNWYIQICRMFLSGRAILMKMDWITVCW